jgi:glycosyltransferase involved in cell wall biosynthesis
MYNPLVSIIIPVYNGSNFLSEAINSALAQTYKKIEIIVVNDGSTDNGETEKVALSYGAKIRYIYKENGGVSTALNKGIEHMNGEWFSWLSHDDLYEEDKIALQMQKVKEFNNEDVIILCSGSLINTEGKQIYHPIKRINKVIDGENLFTEFLSGYNLNGLGFLIPKSALDKCGEFDESMRYLQDLDYWLRLSWLNYSFVCHDDLLVKTRIHRDQTTNTQLEIYKVDENYLIQKHIKEQNSSISEKAIIFLKLYYLLSMKSENKEGIIKIKSILKSKKQFDLTLISNSYYFLFRGKIKNIAKIVYKNVFMKTERD